MGLTVATLNSMLGSQNLNTASLHSADPGTSGASEISGGTYARQAITFGAAANGTRTATSTPVFNVPAGASIRFVGFWDGPTFKGSQALTAETFASAGTYTLTASSVTLS